MTAAAAVAAASVLAVSEKMEKTSATSLVCIQKLKEATGRKRWIRKPAGAGD